MLNFFKVMKYTCKQSEKLIKSLIHNVQGLSFSSAQKMLRLGKVKVNGKKTKENVVVNTSDEVDIYEFKKSMPNIPILYEDENILIVHKPYGIECATRDKSSENTYSLEEIFESKNAIVVHRLDRLTEGLVILARNKDIARKFEKYFKDRLIKKHYTAGVYGTVKDEGIKTAYLKKNPVTALVEISNIAKDGFKEIITEFKTIQTANNKSIVDIILHTGRTHQIRAHFAHLGHPVLNDSKYGNKKNIVDCEYLGYFLTATKIEFNLNDKLKYLNDLNIETKPTWLEYIK